MRARLDAHPRRIDDDDMPSLPLDPEEHPRPGALLVRLRWWHRIPLLGKRLLKRAEWRARPDGGWNLGMGGSGFEDGEGGVREPRKPAPFAGAGAAGLPEPDDEL